jgi:hypothetical protein
MSVENRVLKAKIGEMESQLNSLSTNFNTMPRTSLAVASPTLPLNQRRAHGSNSIELREIRQIFEQKVAQLEKENKDRERAFEELRQGLNHQRSEMEAKDEKIMQLERKLQQVGRGQGVQSDIIGDMQELQQQQRQGNS